ncbi:MAG: hemin uptake protein HemP [Parvibaculaceae bacterium]
MNTAIPNAGGAAEPLLSTAHFSSRDLFDGRRELIIAHGEERYRLCITASNKLILIK